MDSERQGVSKPSFATLLGGILTDARDLFAYELKLARREIGEDIQKTKTALAVWGIALAFLALGLGLLLLMVVHLIHASTEIPLWGCYGIVGASMAVMGIVLLIFGKSKTQEVDFVPQRTAAAVKEDVRWIKTRMISSETGNRREQG